MSAPHVLDELDHTDTDQPVCPHCAHAHEDAWEWGMRDEGQHKCDKCGKPFKWERETCVYYTTERCEPPTDCTSKGKP